MATQNDGGLVARAVREAVGTLVSPAMYGQLVGRALQASSLTEIPESGSAISTFIEGALLREVEQAVGADAAELVAAQLAPIVAHASASQVVRSKLLAPPARAEPPASSRTRAGPPRSASASQAQLRKNPSSAGQSAPAGSGVTTAAATAGRDAFGSDQPTGVAAPPARLRSLAEESRAATPRGRPSDFANTARLKLTREDMDKLQGAPSNSVPGHNARPAASGASPDNGRPRPQLFGASTDDDAMRALGVYLMGTAQVSQIDDLVGLLDALEEPGLHEPIVLLDCRKPTVNVSSIAAIGGDLPRGTTIVLWGASDDAWRDLDRDRLPNCRWVRCSVEATTDDVGSLCQILVASARG